ELMARSGAQGVEWVLVRDVKDPIWGEVEIPPDVKSRIEDDLAAGFIAVLPRKGVALDSGAAFGWWRVHPETGETLGRMEHGEGQSTVEKVITNMILMAPSAYAAAAGYICTKMGKSDGACNPCLIAAVGLLGLALGFVNGAVAFTLGEKSFVMWFGMGAYGAWSNGKRIVGCVNKMAG
ncbi:MAG TPA: hypothetical protein VMT52_17040, partial [Planctomycetota bacterium]|nr:hypothetical protein [Planctomycetota bacterium]